MQLDDLLRSAQVFAVSAAELRWLLERELQCALLERGQHATARVWLQPSPQYRIDEHAGQSRHGRLNEVLAADRIDACLREYVAAAPGGRWRLAFAQFVAVRDGVSEIRLHHPADTADVEPVAVANARGAGVGRRQDRDDAAGFAQAVLPHAKLALQDMQAWPPACGFYVSVAPRGASVDSPHLWQATRSDSVFLRQLCEHFLGFSPHTELYRGAGMIVLSPDADLGPVIGPQGRTVRALQSLAGLRQLHVVRRPAGGPRRQARRSGAACCGEEDVRLHAALRSFRVRGYRLSAPSRPGSPWIVRVGPADARHLVGRGGTKLLFIARLAGSAIRVIEEAAA